MKINCNIDEKMTFKYKERKVKERRYDRCPVSKMKNILKEICDAAGISKIRQ